MSTYIHGTSSEEQTRLSRMNDLINDGSRRELNLQGGERILDLGSGLGQFTRLMARISGKKVVAVEYSDEQRSKAKILAEQADESGLVDFRAGDAGNPPLLEEEWGAFDVAHTRYLLEHVTNPEAVVRAMIRAVRPGGRIILEDDDHDVLRLWPEPAGFASVFRAYLRSYDRIGCDAFVGRRLVSLLHDNGAVPVRNTWIFYGSCAGHPLFEPLAENLINILIGAGDATMEAGGITRREFDATIAAMNLWKKDPSAAIWYSINWAEGKRPEHS